MRSRKLPPLGALDFGAYEIPHVSNINHNGRKYFNTGLQLMLAYQHEEASHYFLACLQLSPVCALAHAFVALCNCPNYNFKGELFYGMSNRPEEDALEQDIRKEFVNKTHFSIPKAIAFASDCIFPSQQLAKRHSDIAIKLVNFESESLEHRDNDEEGKYDQFTHGEVSATEKNIILAISVLTMHPGVDPLKAEIIAGRPYANAMRKAYEHDPNNAEVAYFFVEALMILHAWNLYEFPTGKPLSEDVLEIRTVLEESLHIHPDHVGLCHLYVHLCEMSDNPSQALGACETLRKRFPNAGHLLHMPTHIDVQVGDYDSCVRWNAAAIAADKKTMELFPETANPSTCYYGYILHNYHMLVFGAILGGMEKIGMETSLELNRTLNEKLFEDSPDLAIYLESYSALDIHVLVRFGRWKEIINIMLPKNPIIMLYRSASLRYARSLAYANIGDVVKAHQEVELFEELRANPQAMDRVLHNNVVSDLLNVDSRMLKGEISFFEGKYDIAFQFLREAVIIQDELKYDEPWGKMQPIRHALGGLLLKKGYLQESEEVFRKDLEFYPNNPWSLTGLISCLEKKIQSHTHTCKACKPKESKAQTQDETEQVQNEVNEIANKLKEHKKSEYVDYEVTHACVCCI